MVNDAAFQTFAQTRVSLPSQQTRSGLFVLGLVILGALAVFGPWGLFAWRDSAQALEARNAQIAALTERRDALRNRVDLLDPRAADPDLASELVRENLNVLHADEVVISLED